MNQLFARFAFPVQVAAIALSEPAAVGEVIRVFRSDVLDLTTGQEVEFNPTLSFYPPPLDSTAKSDYIPLLGC